MKFEVTRLDNGLEVVAEVNSQALTSSFGYFVKTGARDETPELSGVSHFLEHMLFKGTDSRTADQLNRELDDIGSQANAYTSEEQTVYYASVLPEFQERTVDVLTDMMRPSLRDDDFEVERKVILEEIAMYDDQPPYGAMELVTEAYFGDHPLAGRVLGTAQSVTDLARAAMRDYHARRYAPNNLALVATGNVDYERLVDQATRLTDGWEMGDGKRKLSSPTINASTSLVVHPPAAQQYTLAIAPGPNRLDERRYAARILASVLGDEGGSRLFWKLVDTGLAESAALFPQAFQDCGIMGTFLACAPDETVDNWQLLQAVIRESVDDSITSHEIDRAKNKICSTLVMSAERPGSRLFSVGNAWTLRGQYERPSEIVHHYASVKAEEIERLLLDWLEAPQVIMSVGPSENETLKSVLEQTHSAS
jgi:predicted Zn-dependent peptidase